ncbi:MAG: iron-containing alcohol dehydrogenase [Desulfarculales bacterium]|jgi:3-deoxy-alpha-D-manno-octulosonate 8-oxidase|nr:iron-containing alcohol dehydrogenase [Desulfarculales bacterium]
MLQEFANTERFWRTEILTQPVFSGQGISRLLALIKERKQKPFLILDSALANQPDFAPLWAFTARYSFDASASEPKTGDVDYLVAHIKEQNLNPDVIVGVGGGGTMDLAKAVGICLANPLPAAGYQGWSLPMTKGADIWVLPTLSGTGAELTPIAVLRGPEKKLGINNAFTAPSLAVIDPSLSKGAKKFNRFYSMMDCYYHHFEITCSKTSAADAIADARDGLQLAREVLGHDLSDFDLELAIKSARASLLGGSSTIGGRVGASHAISYGLSNSSPSLPHSVAVTIAMLGLAQIYGPTGYEETLQFLAANRVPAPRARNYGITESHIPAMVKTALAMDKLWLSHFGGAWEQTVTPAMLEDIYRGIVEKP